MYDINRLDKLNPQERLWLDARVAALKDSGCKDSYEAIIYSIYEEIPVSPIEFIESPDYLNLKDNVFNRIKMLFCLTDLRQVREVFLCLGKGSGKSSMVSLSQLRAIYRLMCYRNPQAHFGLIPGSKLAAINVSIGKDQAKDVVFSKVKSALDNSKWFRNKYKEFSMRIQFLKDVHALCGHSSAASFLGYDTIFAVLDEFDWFRDSREHNNAKELYDALSGSCKTRPNFEEEYKIVVISSPEESEGPILSLIDTVIQTGTRRDDLLLDVPK